MNESQVHTHRFHSNDPEEVADFIGQIYADNLFAAQHARKQDVNMAGHEWNGVGIYDVDYQMPFNFRSEEARPNYLLVSCNRGGSTYSDGKASTGCSPGQVVPISSSGPSTCVTGPAGFGHLSVIIDEQKVNRFMAQWVGRPLIEPVRLALKPVSPDIATQWDIAADCLHQMMNMMPAPDAAAHCLLEHMMKLLITGHANNYSHLLPVDLCADERKARSAIDLIRSDPMRWKTVSAIAQTLGCATNALENSVRRLTGRNSAEHFYEARLRCVNKELATGNDSSFVGTLRAYGFSLSARFIREYRRRFGEPPSATYRNNPNAVDTFRSPQAAVDALCEQTINDFIDSVPGKPISVADLAGLIGMSEYSTIAAFKDRFSRTPMQYVIDRRLMRAQWMLCHTSASILSIALECGFSSQSYLTTTMRKHFGTTPHQLRISGRKSR